MKIRKFIPSDYEHIARWWMKANEPVPTQPCMPTDSTFVIDYNGRPMMSLSVLLTNTKEMSYLEFFVADSEFQGELRKQAAPMLVEHCCNYAKQLGYKRIICFADCAPLKARYKELGMRQTTEGLASFIRDLR